MSPDAFPVLLVALATYRVTRLVVKDDITEPIRKRTVYLLEPDSKIRELFACPWCVGFWLSLVAGAMYWAWPGVIPWLALPFAISTVVGTIATREP